MDDKALGELLYDLENKKEKELKTRLEKDLIRKALMVLAHWIGIHINVLNLRTWKKQNWRP